MIAASTNCRTGFVTSPKIGGSWKSSTPGALNPGAGSVAVMVTQCSFRFHRPGDPKRQNRDDQDLTYLM
jgi:hypothetical protein